MADDAHPEWRSETRAIRAGRAYNYESLAPVLWPSTTYFNRSVDEQYALALSAHPAKFYSRNGSPSVLEFEDAVAALEGAEAALAFASGMGAISSVLLTLCATGDHVVAQSTTFSVTNQLFTMLCPRLGIDVTFVDATDADVCSRCSSPGQDAVGVRRNTGEPWASGRRSRRGRRHRRTVHGVRQHVRATTGAADVVARDRPRDARRDERTGGTQRRDARRDRRRARSDRCRVGSPPDAWRRVLAVRRMERTSRHPHLARPRRRSNRRRRSRWQSSSGTTTRSSVCRTRASTRIRSARWRNGR